MRIKKLLQLSSLFFIAIHFSVLVKGEANSRNSKYADLQKEFDEIRAILIKLRNELSEETAVNDEPVRGNNPVLIKPSDSVEDFDMIRRELESIQVQLNEQPGRGVDVPVETKQITSSYQPFPSSYQRGERTSSPRHEAQRGVGFYILPFMGAYSPKNLEWRTVGGDFKIKEESGFSSGLRLGYGKRYFFTDFQLSYFYNEFDNLDLGFSSVSFSGKVEGMSGHLSGGFKIPLSRSLNLAFGAGIGGTNQDVSFKLTGIPVRDEGFLLSYQLFSGLDYYPINHLRLGLGYRWLRVDDMKLFTGRDLHMAELALGYVF